MKNRTKGLKAHLRLKLVIEHVILGRGPILTFLMSTDFDEVNIQWLGTIYAACGFIHGV